MYRSRTRSRSAPSTVTCSSVLTSVVSEVVSSFLYVDGKTLNGTLRHALARRRHGDWQLRAAKTHGTRASKSSLASLLDLKAFQIYEMEGKQAEDQIVAGVWGGRASQQREAAREASSRGRELCIMEPMVGTELRSTMQLLQKRGGRDWNGRKVDEGAAWELCEWSGLG